MAVCQTHAQLTQVARTPVRLALMLVWICRNQQHQCVVRGNVYQVEKERHGPTSCPTFARICAHQFVQNVNAALCTIAVGHDVMISGFS